MTAGPGLWEGDGPPGSLRLGWRSPPGRGWAEVSECIPDGSSETPSFPPQTSAAAWRLFPSCLRGVPARLL